MEKKKARRRMTLILLGAAGLIGALILLAWASKKAQAGSQSQAASANQQFGQAGGESPGTLQIYISELQQQANPQTSSPPSATPVPRATPLPTTAQSTTGNPLQPSTTPVRVRPGRVPGAGPFPNPGTPSRPGRVPSAAPVRQPGRVPPAAPVRRPGSVPPAAPVRRGTVVRAGVGGAGIYGVGGASHAASTSGGGSRGTVVRVATPQQRPILVAHAGHVGSVAPVAHAPGARHGPPPVNSARPRLYNAA